jgi:integrase
MRREEAYNLASEKTERGIRYVTIRNGKTAQSSRRVPLPDALLPYLPAKISEPLFSPHLTDEVDRKKDLKNLGREVLRQMKRIGVETPGLHTLRHRAKDQLRAGRVLPDQQYEVLGHEKKTVAAGYGHGSPVEILKEWIEHIGGL